jgi:5-methylcytosine-specific restriction endonuclease McrA
MMAQMRRVLVLNTTYEPLNVCSARRALLLLLKDKAEVIEQSDRCLHTGRLSFRIPSVIRLHHYVSVPRGTHRRLSRRAVFARDQHRCQYCGSDRRLTVDHVVPRSKGGPHSWDNVVTSCAPCNTRKGDRTPSAADMRLRGKPRPPDPANFVYMYVDDVSDAWLPYLHPAAVAT